MEYIAEFKDGSGKLVDGQRAIVPIFALYKNKYKFLGTGFYISRNGMLLTAKHCLFNNNNELYTKFFINHILEDGKYLIREIERIYYNTSDVAIMVGVQMVSKFTKQELRNPVIPISTRRPKIGDAIASFGYPDTKVINEEQHIYIGESWHFGKIEDFHSEGTSILRNCCYQSSMYLRGGSSGGPVVTSGGPAFAINSTGADVAPGITPYSFLTPIDLCLDIEIDVNDVGKLTMKKLIELNQFMFIA